MTIVLLHKMKSIQKLEYYRNHYPGNIKKELKDLLRVRIFARLKRQSNAIIRTRTCKTGKASGTT